MSISALGSNPGLAAAAPISAPLENEAAERVPDNEAAEASPSLSLKEGTGTKIDITA